MGDNTFERDLTSTRQQHSMRIQGHLAPLRFTWDQATLEVRAPGVVPFTARDLNNARDQLRALFDPRANA